MSAPKGKRIEQNGSDVNYHVTEWFGEEENVGCGVRFSPLVVWLLLGYCRSLSPILAISLFHQRWQVKWLLLFWWSLLKYLHTSLLLVCTEFCLKHFLHIIYLWLCHLLAKRGFFSLRKKMSFFLIGLKNKHATQSGHKVGVDWSSLCFFFNIFINY